MKIDLEKLICSLMSDDNYFINGFYKNLLKKALLEQGIEYRDGSLHYIGEEEKRPDTIKFKEDLNDVEKLTEVTSQVPHPKMYYHLLRDELPLMKEGQYIVTERVQVETLQEFRNKAASLEESKLFLPLLDSEIERLLNLERLHLSRIAGFVVPKEIRFLERH